MPNPHQEGQVSSVPHRKRGTTSKPKWSARSSFHFSPLLKHQGRETFAPVLFPQQLCLVHKKEIEVSNCFDFGTFFFLFCIRQMFHKRPRSGQKSSHVLKTRQANGIRLHTKKSSANRKHSMPVAVFAQEASSFQNPPLGA